LVLGRRYRWRPKERETKRGKTGIKGKKSPCGAPGGKPVFLLHANGLLLNRRKDGTDGKKRGARTRCPGERREEEPEKRVRMKGNWRAKLREGGGLLCFGHLCSSYMVKYWQNEAIDVSWVKLSGNRNYGEEKKDHSQKFTFSHKQHFHKKEQAEKVKAKKIRKKGGI